MLDIVTRRNFFVGCMDKSSECISVKLNYSISQSVQAPASVSLLLARHPTGERSDVRSLFEFVPSHGPTVDA